MHDDDVILVSPISVKEAKNRLRKIIPKLKIIQKNYYKYIQIEKKFRNAELEEYSRIRYQLDVIEEDIYHLRREISMMDCIVKDPRIGLIDFIAYKENKRVWLCFRLGEKKLNYYHGWNDGYIGRKLIDFD